MFQTLTLDIVLASGASTNLRLYLLGWSNNSGISIFGHVRRRTKCYVTLFSSTDPKCMHQFRFEARQILNKSWLSKLFKGIQGQGPAPTCRRHRPILTADLIRDRDQHLAQDRGRDLTRGRTGRIELGELDIMEDRGLALAKTIPIWSLRKVCVEKQNSDMTPHPLV